MSYFTCDCSLRAQLRGTINGYTDQVLSIIQPNSGAEIINIVAKQMLDNIL